MCWSSSLMSATGHGGTGGQKANKGESYTTSPQRLPFQSMVQPGIPTGTDPQGPTPSQPSSMLLSWLGGRGGSEILPHALSSQTVRFLHSSPTLTNRGWKSDLQSPLQPQPQRVENTSAPKSLREKSMCPRSLPLPQG
ncbi:gluconolactonase [Platysternon megacephalum]|uniref:Gluconolactonase n=1 Tax=Platysternon megacephalum TaxID=55544 RepID=A0A4D9DDC0_9SAUR|nr:gluconolactonase [Platysternon megacephalum]